jgi:probable phosphoglycerate mutase
VTRAIHLFARPFYFVRHGESENNATGLITGSLDVDLTAQGRAQARVAAEALAGEPITGIYTSPMKRARETAEPIAMRLRLPVKVVKALAERTWGALEGRPRNLRVAGVTPEGAETPETFAARVLGALATIDERVPLIVAHSGVFRVMCRTLDIVDARMPVPNGCPHRFIPLPRGAWRLEQL